MRQITALFKCLEPGGALMILATALTAFFTGGTFNSIFLGGVFTLFVLYNVYRHASNSKIESSDYFYNKHICITGGSYGLGKALAEKILKESPKIITLMARNIKKLSSTQLELCEEAKKEGIDVTIQVISADLANEESLIRAFSAAQEGQGAVTATGNKKETDWTIDTLICNAGSAIIDHFENLTNSELSFMMNLNYFGTVRSIKQVLPYMVEKKSGGILIVNSMASLCPIYGYSAYSPSKAALNSLAICLDQEYRLHNIFISTAYPPNINTVGFDNENKRKPLVTRNIEGSTTIDEPNSVANRIINQFKQGKARITFGFEGYILSELCSSFSPVENFFNFLFQISFMGILRAVAMIFNTLWWLIIKKFSKNKISNLEKDS